MFQKIEDYMLKSRDERTNHIRLDQECIEIGGLDSREYRGLLAHTLKTTIPSKKKFVCAHACNNHACSNPLHLYWATYAENLADARIAGRSKNISQNTLEKYGAEKAREIAVNNGRKGGLIGGKSAAKLRVLSESEIELWRKVFERSDIHRHGWLSRAQKELKCSHTWIRKVAKKYFPDLHFFTRQNEK